VRPHANLRCTPQAGSPDALVIIHDEYTPVARYRATGTSTRGI
jgi:hypothetical protein